MFKIAQSNALGASPCHQCASLSCPTCGTGDWKHVRRVRGASISQCGRCGLLATTDFLVGNATADGLYETSLEHYEEYGDRYLPRRIPAFERVISSLERFRRTGRLLEVGCSYGDFLEVARRAGWRADGIEISSYACQVARSKGFEVHSGELEGLALNRNSYDVIAMWDVIEHLRDPGEIVQRCKELLAPGGALVARTPNADALERRGGLPGLAYRQLAYPANTREHVFHFTPKSLSQLLKAQGFERVETDDYGGWEERVISGGSAPVRMGRYLIMRYAWLRRWPYEFVVTAMKV